MKDLNEMNVLIADDMESMCTTIKSIMRFLHFGRHFFFAHNGNDALKMLQNEDIDLAILDNNMPGMLGVELLDIIREDEKLCDLPIIMVTADASKEFVTKAAEMEIDAYILKPLTVQLMKERVSAVIEKAKNPPPMLYHLKQASKFYNAGDMDRAIKEAALAMEANPKSSRPVRELGHYYLKKGDLSEAEKYLLKAAKMNNLDVTAFHHLGDLYLNLGEIDKAIKYLNKAMEISPRNYERGLNLGKLLVQRNMAAEAIPVFNKVFHLSDNPFEIKEQIADFCADKGAKEYAANLLADIVKHKKERGDLLFKLGTLLQEIGDAGKALPYLEEAEILDKDNIDIKLHIAAIYLAQGMAIRAERPLKAILEHSPEHKQARELLRQCV